MLVKDRLTVRTWLAGPIWQEIMEQARKTLERTADE